MIAMKKSLTTGEIANYCQVNLRTVIRWIDKGKLKGYKLPGRGNNRVDIDNFLLFLKEYNMPIPDELSLLTTADNILIVDDEPAMANAIGRVLKMNQFECEIAHSAFEAGMLLTSFKPKLITLDLSMPSIDGYKVIVFGKEYKVGVKLWSKHYNYIYE